MSNVNLKGAVNLKSITFPDFIETYTIPKLAKACGVCERTVYRWKHGEILPSVHRLVKIHSLSKGRLTCDAIVQHCSKPRKLK